MDFHLFFERLHNRQIHDAKEQVTISNANICDGNGFGVLWYVCADGPDDPELFHYFMELVGSLLGGCGRDNATLLHKAANTGKPKILRAILDLGIINVDAKTHLIPSTPLYWAICNNKLDCARLLIDAGAANGLTPLDRANLIRDSVCDRVLWDVCNTDTASAATQRLIDFIVNRDKARAASVAILSLLERKSALVSGNGKDVLRMVARCVWLTRGHTKSWSENKK